jgi:hypothetical protein
LSCSGRNSIKSNLALNIMTIALTIQMFENLCCHSRESTATDANGDGNDICDIYVYVHVHIYVCDGNANAVYDIYVYLHVFDLCVLVLLQKSAMKLPLGLHSKELPPGNMCAMAIPHLGCL